MMQATADAHRLSNHHGVHPESLYCHIGPPAIRCQPVPTDSRSQVGRWQDIATHSGHGAVLVSRPTDKYFYEATTAFVDATGVWRVFRSIQGMAILPFVPTHWQALPAPPEDTLSPKDKTQTLGALFREGE